MHTVWQQEKYEIVSVKPHKRIAIKHVVASGDLKPNPSLLF